MTDLGDNSNDVAEAIEAEAEEPNTPMQLDDAAESADMQDEESDSAVVEEAQDAVQESSPFLWGADVPAS